MGRARFDLDGIPLHGENRTNMVLAILRHRTTKGLNLLMPESGDFVVEWQYIKFASADLGAGVVRIEFTAEFAAEQNWLRGETVLTGPWLDRFQMVSNNH